MTTRKKKAKRKTKTTKKKRRSGKPAAVPFGGKPVRRRAPKPVDPPLTLVDHLGELRGRLISVLVFALIAAVGVFFYTEPILNLLAAPAQKLIFTAPAEAFFAYLKLSLAGGLVLSLPWIARHTYGFIAPALEPKDRLAFGIGLFICLILFYTGAGFALALLKPAMEFFLSFAGQRLDAAIKVDDYFSFVLTLVMACGFVFEMPVLVWVLAKIGVINSYMLTARWREAMIGILLISAFITPADIFTMVALALPMGLLYVMSIYVARWANR